jgi:hypothetical protein
MSGVLALSSSPLCVVFAVCPLFLCAALTRLSALLCVLFSVRGVTHKARSQALLTGSCGLCRQAVDESRSPPAQVCVLGPARGRLLCGRGEGASGSAAAAPPHQCVALRCAKMHVCALFPASVLAFPSPARVRQRYWSPRLTPAVLHFAALLQPFSDGSTCRSSVHSGCFACSAAWLQAGGVAQ